MFDSAAMSKKPNGKCLNESQRCEIIAKLSKTDVASKRAIAREYELVKELSERCGTSGNKS
jgi:hypothetical protein